MAETEILPFATAPGADVMSQEDYEDLAARTDGFSTGTARSEQLNKVWRQSSFIAAGLAAWIASKDIDVPDDGDLPALVNEIEDAIVAAIAANAQFTTGDVKLTIKTVADAGWVMFNDGTIGDASSSATTLASATTQALFTLLWNNTTNANCAVSGGRGASAAADFAAHKTIALPKALGRALAVAGAGAGLTSRALAEAVGEEEHTLTSDEMPEHTHRMRAVTELGYAAGTPQEYGLRSDQPFTAAGSLVESTGGGDAHNNMQPTVFLNVMVKL